MYLERIKQYKNFIFLGCIVLITVVLLAIIVLKQFINNPQQTVELPSTIQQNFKSQINKTSKSEVAALPNRKTVRTTENGTEYSFTSVSKTISDVIVTKDNQVVFEKKFTADSDYRHPSLSQYLSMLGEPEEIIPGSFTFGKNVNYYIYASIGITIIGRPFSDEVEEVQQYQPMSAEEYKTLWGKDIMGGDKSQQEKL